MANLSAEQIFHAAREMPAEKREGYLEGVCGTDVALRSKVDGLLKADAEAGSFMEAVDRHPIVRTPISLAPAKTPKASCVPPGKLCE